MAGPAASGKTNHVNQSSSAARISGTGRIAARIDRLPLTWVQWRLALITQIFWGVIIAADGIPAKLYPFIWGPSTDFGTGALSVLLAVQFGVGILVGEYLLGIAADRWGRRTALLLSSLAVSLPLWPTALTNNFGWLLLFFGLSSIGMGGVLSTNVVYMGESCRRASEAASCSPRKSLPLWCSACSAMSLEFFGCPRTINGSSTSSPSCRWSCWCRSHCGPCRNRHAGWKRTAITSGRNASWQSWKPSACSRSGLSQLPEPEFAAYAVPVSEHVPMRELFRGEYGQRTILLLVAWIIGYAGLVYGFTGYLPVLFSQLRTVGQ